MFAGMLDQKIVYASHPVIVVEGEQVCGAFGSVEEAERFIVTQGSYSAVVYTLRDSNWAIARDRRINPLLPQNGERQWRASITQAPPPSGPSGHPAQDASPGDRKSPHHRR